MGYRLKKQSKQFKKTNRSIKRRLAKKKITRAKKYKGGVKTYKHDKKKTPRTTPYTRPNNIPFKSNLPSGSNLRNELVDLYKQRRMDEYWNLVGQIIDEYNENGDKGFFIHLDRQITTFNNDTLVALEPALTRMQEAAIPESMIHLSYILEHK